MGAAHEIRIARVLRVLRLIRLIKLGKLVCRLLACVEEEAGLQAGLQELLHQLCGKSGSAHQQGHAQEWVELSSALAKVACTAVMIATMVEAVMKTDMCLVLLSSCTE